MTVRTALQAWRLAAAHALAGLIAPTHQGRTLRALCFRAGGIDVALGVQIAGGTGFHGQDVTIGRGSYIGPCCQFHPGDGGPITVGRNVAVAPGVVFASATHHIGPHRRRAGTPFSRPIVVHDGAWIGAGAILLPGATVGAGAVVGAGSVVRGDVPPDHLYVERPHSELTPLRQDGR